MSLDRASNWLHLPRPFFVDAVRIYLGAGLLIKGAFFLTHPESLAAGSQSVPGSIVSWVPYIHLLGGFLLAIGLLTRIAALIQIPIVAGALVLVNLPRVDGMQAREAFEFSALTLFLLVLISIWGAGPWSVDQRLRSRHTPLHAQSWLAGHSDLFIDLIRGYLGVGLFVKGFYILEHGVEFQKLVDDAGSMPISLIAAAHYVIPVHFVGGLMLLLGLGTRLAALAQIPLLVGAIFYVYLPRFATLELRQNLEFTGLVLFLLCLLALFGAGRYSLDTVLQRAEKNLEREFPEPADAPAGA